MISFELSVQAASDLADVLEDGYYTVSSELEQLMHTLRAEAAKSAQLLCESAACAIRTVHTKDWECPS